MEKDRIQAQESVSGLDSRVTQIDPPSVSVVIPLHNSQEWIGETLSSVLRQTHPSELLEVIVVDDGSTDQGPVLAESILKGSPLKYSILKTSRGGASKARNIGWKHAAHPWIQMLDADDVLSPSKIAIQAEATGALTSEIAVVYSGWQRLEQLNDQWQPTSAVFPRIGKDAVRSLLEADNFLQLGSLLIRRAWLERVSGFHEELRFIEDVDLLLRIAMSGGGFQPVDVAVPALFYRQHPKSLSRSDSREFVQGCVRNAALAERYWRKRNQLSPERIGVLTEVYFQGARYFASVDRKTFCAMVDKIDALVPRFLPSRPAFLRRLSRWVGYRRAEQIAVLYRRLRGRGGSL